MPEPYNVTMVMRRCGKLEKVRKNYLEEIRAACIDCLRYVDDEDVTRHFVENEIFKASKKAGAHIQEPDERLWREIKQTPDADTKSNGKGNGEEHVNGNGPINVQIDKDLSTDPAAALTEMNAIYAVVSYSGQFRVMRCKPHPRFPLQTDFEFSRKGDFINLVQNPKIPVSVNTPRGKTQRQEPRGKWWLEHPEHRHFDGIGFDPGKGPVIEIYNSINKRTERISNLYSGFAVVPKEGKCDLYLQHIFKHVCGADKDVYKYVISWMASGLQNPGNAELTALSFRGDPGGGKGVAATQYGYLFGSNFSHLTDSEHIVGRFNAHTGRALLIFADEAMFAGDPKAADRLKTRISERTKILEPKGIDPIEVGNYARWIFSTNHDQPLRIEAKDRRYLALHVTLPEDMMGEKGADKRKTYFKAIINEMDNGGRSALLHYLLQYDISGFNSEAIPQTEELQRQKLLSAPPAVQIIIEIAKEGCLPGAVISNPSMARAHLEFDKGLLDQMKKRGGRGLQYETDNSLAENLKRWGFEKRHTMNGNVWAAPTLPDLRARLKSTYPAIEWPSQNEWEMPHD